MTVSAVTRDTTGRVLDWGDDAGVRSAEAGETRHTGILDLYVPVINSVTPRYTKVVGVTFAAMNVAECDAVDVEDPEGAPDYSAVDAHTVLSHSDTTATGAELDELTDGSSTTLHTHPVDDNQTAAEVSFTANGDIAATDVQAAIQEVRDDTDTKLAGYLELDGSAAMTGALDMNSNKISQYKQAQYDIQTGGTTGTVTYSCNDGVAFNSDLTGNITSISITNKPAAGLGMKMTIIFVQDATARTIPTTWTGVDWWINEVGPTMPTTNNKTLIVTLDVTNSQTIGSWKAQP